MAKKKIYRVKSLIENYLSEEKFKDRIKADEMNKTGNADLLNGLYEAYKEIIKTEMKFPDDGSYHVFFNIQGKPESRLSWQFPDVSKFIPQFFFWDKDDDAKPVRDYNLSLTDWGLVLGAEVEASKLYVEDAPFSAMSILMEMTTFGYSMEIIGPKIAKSGTPAREFFTETDVRESNCGDVFEI